MTNKSETQSLWKLFKRNKRLQVVGIVFSLIYAAYLAFFYRITDSSVMSLVIAVFVFFVWVGFFLYISARWIIPEIQSSLWFKRLYQFVGCFLIGIGLCIWLVQKQSLSITILTTLDKIVPLFNNQNIEEFQQYFPLINTLSISMAVAIVFFGMVLLIEKTTRQKQTSVSEKKFVLIGYAFMLFFVTGFIFCTDSMQIGPGQQSIIFYGGTETYVTYRLNEDQMSFSEDLQKYGGFMFGPDSEGDFDVYMSSTGFYSSILKLGQTVTHINPDDFAKGSRVLFAFILAGMLTGLSLTIKKKFGLIPSVIFSIFPIITYWFIGPAGYLIWFYFLLFVPFFLSIFLYTKVIYKRLSFKKFLLIIYVAQFFLFLRGYTYLPGLIAAAAVPVLFYDMQEKKPLKTIIVNVFFVGLMGLLGFITAILIHLIQIGLFLGNKEQAISYILNRMISRGTTGDTNLQTPAQIFEKWLFVRVFYISDRVFAIFPQWKKNFDLYNNFANFHIFAFVEAGIAIFLRVFMKKKLFSGVQVQKEIHLLFNLAITMLVAMVASWSWFPALGHMAHHYHMNGIMYMIPFGITLFIFTGLLIQTLIRWLVEGLHPQKIL